MKDANNSRKSAGGKARAEKLTPEQRKAIAQKAAKARWDSVIPMATHTGTLDIGNADIQCFVLEDGQRIISTRGVMKALGRAWRGRKYSGTELPVFVEAKNLTPFINDTDRTVLVPIQFRTAMNGLGEGFNAEILPTVCEIYLKARELTGTLTPHQFSIAQQCEILLRSIARVGITALIDEATGYQEVRDRRALQAILDKYLRKEFAAWAKRFPDDFYKEMFRLKGWKYPTEDNAKPGVVGRYTNNIVYERLAPGLIEELQNLNPKDDNGNRKSKHHQWLTTDVGHPALSGHLHAVMAIMRISRTWDQFMLSIDEAFPKKGCTLSLAFE